MVGFIHGLGRVGSNFSRPVGWLGVDLLQDWLQVCLLVSEALLTMLSVLYVTK